MRLSCLSTFDTGAGPVIQVDASILPILTARVLSSARTARKGLERPIRRVCATNGLLERLDVYPQTSAEKE